MEIKRLEFQKQEIEIKETYIDTDGKIKERVKKIMVPTGEVKTEKDKSKI